MTAMKLAMGQLLVEGGEPKRNLDRAEVMIRDAAAQACDVILLPECLDLGWTNPSALNESEAIPGPRSDRLCQLAKELGIHVCAGLTEKDGETTYNSSVLIDESGSILLKYRKINVLEVGKPFYSIGNMLSVGKTKFGSIGLNICADNYIDSLEIGHCLARMGAQVILSPSSWTVDYSLEDTENPYSEKWIKPLHILANLYDLVIISVTSVGYIVGGPYEGKKMVGCSLAVGRRGAIAEGAYNEVAGQLVTIEFEVPAPHQTGTAIGQMLTETGYYKHG